MTTTIPDHDIRDDISAFVRAWDREDGIGTVVAGPPSRRGAKCYVTWSWWEIVFEGSLQFC
jgi:hypothetical protein